MGKVYVVGVGMTKFEKPETKGWTYPEMAKEAGTKALADAGIAYEDVQQVCVGYVFGDSTAGQRSVYQLGLTGVPIYNVNNNCATGSTALFMAKQFVQGGLADCVLALGFEEMRKGSLTSAFTDRINPMDQHYGHMFMLKSDGMAPPAPLMFGNAGWEHMQRYGTTPEMFARIGHKNHKHSVNNPYAQFQDEYTLEEILSSTPIYEGVLTKLQCSPTSDGSAAAVVASERFVKERGLEDQAVEILAMEMVTDQPGVFETDSLITLVGADMSREAANKVYEQTGRGPEDVDVIELHDCFSTNELITYEALGLAPEGKGGELIMEGATTYGGQWVVNPSGGLISKGHPLGATGLAQCAEINWQLRGQADARQVDGVQLGLTHNIGLGGAVVVGMYAKASF
jgi:acetyl-CoA acyltransferase